MKEIMSVFISDIDTVNFAFNFLDQNNHLAQRAVSLKH